jgi:putative tryptophan/tyrosine transport system substrate-binding protein
MTSYTRRQIVQGAGAVGLGLLAGCGRLPGQGPAAKVARVGYLATNEEPARLDAFRHGLTELGYVVGQNLVIEARFAGGQSDRLPAVAAELVGLPVDVILVRGTVPVRTAMAATTTIPLVTVGARIRWPLGSRLAWPDPAGTSRG